MEENESQDGETALDGEPGEPLYHVVLSYAGSKFLSIVTDDRDIADKHQKFLMDNCCGVWCGLSKDEALVAVEAFHEPRLDFPGITPDPSHIVYPAYPSIVQTDYDDTEIAPVESRFLGVDPNIMGLRQQLNNLYLVVPNLGFDHVPVMSKDPAFICRHVSHLMTYYSNRTYHDCPVKRVNELLDEFEADHIECHLRSPLCREEARVILSLNGEEVEMDIESAKVDIARYSLLTF